MFLILSLAEKLALFLGYAPNKGRETMNNPYISLLPRGFKEKGRILALQAYDSACLLPGPKPQVTFKAAEAAFIIENLAQLRKKNWRSSKPMGPMTDATGIFNEFAFSRFFNEPGDQVIKAFEKNLGGDPGYERIIGGYKIDDKGTAHREKIYSLSNKAAESTPAQVFTFGSVKYYLPFKVVVTLEGWAFTADVKPWIRKHQGGNKVRLWTLHREGVLQSMSTAHKLA